MTRNGGAVTREVKPDHRAEGATGSGGIKPEPPAPRAQPGVRQASAN
jgi:hypothetical protein